MTHNINFDEDESELRAGFTDEEIRKAENKEWHLVPNNTFPEHKITFLISFIFLSLIKP